MFDLGNRSINLQGGGGVRVSLTVLRPSVVHQDPVGSALFCQSGSVSILTKCNEKLHFFPEVQYTVQMGKVMTPMTLTRNMKQCKLVLLEILHGSGYTVQAKTFRKITFIHKVL
jgi:hypothetical protein